MAIHGNKSQGARTKALSRLQERRPAGAGGDRHRGARHRHRPVAARRQLRAAERARKTTCTASAAPAAPAAQGEAISLVCVDEDGFLRDIERLIKRSIPREVVPGFERARREGRADRARPHDDRRRRQPRWPFRRWRPAGSQPGAARTPRCHRATGATRRAAAGLGLTCAAAPRRWFTPRAAADNAQALNQRKRRLALATRHSGAGAGPCPAALHGAEFIDEPSIANRLAGGGSRRAA